MSLLSYIDHIGLRTKLGLCPSRDGIVPRYGTSNDLVPRSQWTPFSVWNTVPLIIKDQGSTNSCNCNAGTLALEIARYQEFGIYEELDPYVPYAILCNGNDNTGTSILDLLSLLETYGAPPALTVPKWTYDPRVIPLNAAKLASRFRISIGSQITTVDEFVSAYMRLQPINCSICVGEDFCANKLDEEGVPPLDVGPDNHAVVAWGDIKYSKKRRELLIGYINSWGTRWGLNGKFYLPLSQVIGRTDFSGFNVKSATVDPNGNFQVPSL